MTRAAPWPVTLPDADEPAPHAKADHVLDRLDRLIDWKAAEAILAAIPINRATRPRYPSLLLFKIFLLQQWYGLSDPSAENAVNDRKALARFAGLPDRAAAPSYSTINRFRLDLARRNLAGPLLQDIANQLDAKGFELREGAMVEPSLVERRPRSH